MWIKILKYVFVAAKATGLDKKVKDWVKGKLHKAENKIVDAANKKLSSISDTLDLVELDEEEAE